MESCNLDYFIDPLTEDLSIWSHLDLIIFVSVRLLMVRGFFFTFETAYVCPCMCNKDDVKLLLNLPEDTIPNVAWNSSEACLHCDSFPCLFCSWSELKK